MLKKLTILTVFFFSALCVAADLSQEELQVQRKRAAFELVQKVKDKELVKAVGYRGNIPNSEAARFWLEKGANPNAIIPVKMGEITFEASVLLIASHHANKNPALLHALIEYNADLNTLYEEVNPLTGDCYSTSHLHEACSLNGSEESAKILLAAGASWRATNSYEQSPLHVAAATKKKALITEMVQRGAQVNALDEVQETPLSKIYTFLLLPDLPHSILPDAEIAKYLLFSKADINKTNILTENAPLASFAQFCANFGITTEETTEEDVAAMNHARPVYEKLVEFRQQMDNVLAHGLSDADIEQCERLSDQARHSILERTHLNPKKGNLFRQLQARQEGRKMWPVHTENREAHTKVEPYESKGDRKGN